MNAKTLFTYCLLACSVLAGAEALADPILSSQSTVNSIEFSFMNYSSTLAPYVSSSSSLGNTSSAPTSSSLSSTPSLSMPPSALLTPSPSVELAAPSAPAAAPSPQEIHPVTEIFVPSTAGQPSSPQIIDTATSPQAAAAAVIPEPGTLALLGLGFSLLVLRRREGFHD